MPIHHSPLTPTTPLRVFHAIIAGALLAAGPALPSAAVAQDDQPKQQDEQAKRFEQFTEQMREVKLVGNFTILGREEGKLSKEEYVIHGVSKLPEGDKWLFKTQIKYGKYDVSLPLPLNVKWAGDTPVITLTDLTIPTLGTFSARVVLYNKKYAGTWTHGEVGGHLFGVIEKIEAEQQE